MPHVFHQLAILRVLLPADAAQVRFVPGVRHHVYLLGHLLREALVAYLADERSLAGVQPPVVHQLPVRGERLRARVTGVRLLAEVRLHVVRMGVALGETLVANVARIGFVAGVQTHVRLQVAGVAVVFAADGAGVRWARVLLHVAEELGLFGEGLVAGRTTVGVRLFRGVSTHVASESTT